MRHRTPLLQRASITLIAAVLTACAPSVPTPVESARAAAHTPAPRKTADATAQKITVHRDAY